MSRIGKQPVAIPAGVKVSVKDGQIAIEGPKGKLSLALPPRTCAKVDAGKVVVSREPAILSTPLGQVDLPTGDFDLIAIENEAYTPRADFRFTPSDGAKGFVTVTVCLGSGATWAYRPPPTALPIFRTGGWNTYYAGTDKMAWSGGFYHGVRSGEFTYWDEAGNITNREEWENGTKKN